MTSPADTPPLRRALNRYGLAVLLALGAGILGYSGVSEVYEVQGANVVVTGEVIKLTRTRGSNKYVDCPTVEFQYQGFTQQRVPRANDCDGQPVGTKLQLRIDPDDPQNWHVDSFQGRYAMPIFSLIIALLCSLGLIISLLRARGSAAEAPNEAAGL